MRALRSVLNCLLDTAPALSALVGQPLDAIEAKTTNCMAMIGPRIQSTLLQLTKLSSKGTKKS